MSGGTFPAADCAERRCRLLRRCRSRMRRHRQTVRNRRTGRSVLCRRDRNFAPRRLPCFRPGGGYRSSFSRPEHPFAGCGRNGGGSPAWCGFNGSRLFRKFFYALKIACPGKLPNDGRNEKAVRDSSDSLVFRVRSLRGGLPALRTAPSAAGDLAHEIVVFGPERRHQFAHALDLFSPPRIRAAEGIAVLEPAFEGVV